MGGQFWLLRGRTTRRDTVEILLQLPFSFLFALFIDLNMALTEGLVPAGYAASLALLLFGCLVQSVGVVLELKPRVAMMSAVVRPSKSDSTSNSKGGQAHVAP